MDQGLSETAKLQKKFNINSYAPTMLVFKENAEKPADIIQVGLLAGGSCRAGSSIVVFFFFNAIFFFWLSAGQRNEEANN